MCIRDSIFIPADDHFSCLFPLRFSCCDPLAATAAMTSWDASPFAPCTSFALAVIRQLTIFRARSLLHLSFKQSARDQAARLSIQVRPRLTYVWVHTARGAVRLLATSCLRRHTFAEGFAFLRRHTPLVLLVQYHIENPEAITDSSSGPSLDSDAAISITIFACSFAGDGHASTSWPLPPHLVHTLVVQSRAM